MRHHRLLRMITGDTVIAMMDSKIDIDTFSDYVTLHYPIQIINDFYETETGMVERYNLKQWESLSGDNKIKIDMSAVMYMTDIKQMYMEGYDKMVSYFYLGGQEEEKETLKKITDIFDGFDADTKIH